MAAQTMSFGALRTPALTRRCPSVWRSQQLCSRRTQFKPVASSSNDGPGGVAVLHMFETLGKPPLFESFLEGMTHVVEVGRYHPGFCTANIHTCLDQEALDKMAPFSYLNFTVFKDEEAEMNSLEKLSEPHSDWMTSMEFGHDGQTHHPILVREVEHIGGSDASQLQQGLDGGFSCSQDDIVIVVAAQEAKDANGWKEWSGADKLSQLGDFCSASLFEAVDPETSQFNYVMKAEMKALSDVDLDSMAEIIQDINEGGDDGTFAVVYRSLIQVTKGGQPVDLLFAERAKAESEEAGAEA